jgi:penicillin-insensitive murein endopeptidase
MVRITRAIALGLLVAACSGAPEAPSQATHQPTVSKSNSQPAKQLFGAAKRGSAQPNAPYGGYAKGCQAGAVQLPETGPTWQAMRLSRNRNWGQPEMIAYLKRLSAKAAKQPGWQGLYIGDISQPRGGPMLTGHRSHQLGLDADIWMLPPSRLNLSTTEREKYFLDFHAPLQRGLRQ